ncbi:287_t:CDS:2, partial [Ambispora gerdemannii]
RLMMIILDHRKIIIHDASVDIRFVYLHLHAKQRATNVNEMALRIFMRPHIPPLPPTL